MCNLRDQGKPQHHTASRRGSRRDFLKASTATAVSAAGMNFLTRRLLRRSPAWGLQPTAAHRGGAMSFAADTSCRWTRRSVTLPRATCWSRARNRRRRAESETGFRRGSHRRDRPHRHAGLHRYAPPSVRDRAAQFPRQRHPDQRRLGLAERGSDVLRIHSAQIRARVPAGGRVHQRALRRTGATRRRRHDGARHLADPSLARALRRRHPGAVRHGAPRRSRLFRECRWCCREPVSAGRDPHQAAVVLLERPARPHDHGRRGLSGRADLHAGLAHRAPARSPDCGAHPLAIRHPPDPGRSRPGHGRRQQRHRPRPRQPVHPHDRDVRPGLAGGQGRRRAGLDRLPDRNEHAARHSAHPQDAKPGHGAVPELGRRSHDDGGLLYPDALRDDHAARWS